MYTQGKPGQVTGEKYRNAACHSRGKNHVAKVQVEMKLDRGVGDNKKRIFPNILVAKGSVKIALSCCEMRMVFLQTETETRQRC